MLRLHSYSFVRPESLQAALGVFADDPDASMFIAGGTDLMPNMKHRLFMPRQLIGLKRLSELHGVGVRDGELRIGGAETLSAIARHPLVLEHAPSLARAAGLVAGPQLRNMGTIGGNLCLDTRCTYYNQTEFWRNALGFCLKKDGDKCHVTQVGKKCVAAHSADTPPVLMTLGGVVDLESARGSRSVPVADLFIADGIWNSVRRKDEIVVGVRVPLTGVKRRSTFIKLRQRQSIDFPLLNVAVSVDFTDADEIADLRMVVSALGSRPRVVSGLDKIANGQRFSPELIDAMAERAFQQCHPLTNIIVDTEWRRAMVPVHVRRALNQVATAA